MKIKCYTNIYKITAKLSDFCTNFKTFPTTKSLKKSEIKALNVSKKLKKYFKTCFFNFRTHYTDNCYSSYFYLNQKRFY